MLHKTKRLNLSAVFKWVSSGEKISTPFFTLFIKFGENKFPKIGVAVGSKEFPKATGRNRAKRLMFSAFEKIYQDLPEGINIIALPRKGIDNVKSEELLRELKEALEKIL